MVHAGACKLECTSRERDDGRCCLQESLELGRTEQGSRRNGGLKDAQEFAGEGEAASSRRNPLGHREL